VDLTLRSGGTPARTTSTVPWRGIAFVAVLLGYALLTMGVIVRSPLLTVDRDLYRLNLQGRWPELYPVIHTFVMLGQRAPSTLMALPWIVWQAWRLRSPRPLVLLATALFVLNLSVGVVKVYVGRLGPLRTSQVHAVFEGGNIFPSGHVSNTVVLYGVLAWLVSRRYRKVAIIAAVFISVTVGMSTVYLDTHWLSDVLAGWAAGGLVLIALPWLMPTTQRWSEAALRPVQRWLSRRVSRKPDAGEPLGGGPEPRSDGHVFSGPGRVDPARVSVQLTDPVRPVEAAGLNVGRGGGVEGGQGPHGGALRDQPVG